jgi:hypothetical protein
MAMEYLHLWQRRRLPLRRSGPMTPGGAHREQGDSGMPGARTETARRREIAARPVADLLLDPQNPRLALDADATQLTILKSMYAQEALDELALSFARNGYFWEEPLVVVPARVSGKFTVVEGNRRVAALKLLLTPKLRQRLGVVDFPSLTAARVRQLASVPTVLYPNRTDVVPYLGFRHITGVKTWEPYAKARYVADLVMGGRRIEDIEDGIGDTARTVKKLYQSYVVYSQIRNELNGDAKSVRANFSLLEVLLTSQPIKEFLGAPRALPSGRVDSIIPVAKLDALRQVVSFVFGDTTRGELRVITDSRQIPHRLAPVIADPDAYEHLSRTRDLEAAYERSGGERQYLLRQLASAGRATERALGVFPLYRMDGEVRSAVERLRSLVAALDGTR